MPLQGLTICVKRKEEFVITQSNTLLREKGDAISMKSIIARGITKYEKYYK